MTDLPPKPQRWKLYLPFIALAVVAVGWSGFWKIAAGMTTEPTISQMSNTAF